MKHNPKAVFDTNIFISAIIFGGNPQSCFDLARNQELQLFTTAEILLELAIKLKNKFAWTDPEIHYLLEGFPVFSTLVSPKQKLNIVKNDATDNMILECALEAKADYIISGDKKHLLSLKSFKNILIVSAKEFLDLYYGKN